MVTGTGTIGDPYIVSTWDDFTSKCGEDGVHIKWADSENKTLDFNDINPNGYDTYLEIYANVDFNGWTFMNYYCHDGMFQIAPGVIIDNVSFLNINCNCKTNSIAIGLPPNSSGNYTLRKCIFAGLLNVAGTESGSGKLVKYANIYSSAFTIYALYRDYVGNVFNDSNIYYSLITLCIHAKYTDSYPLMFNTTINNSTLNVKTSSLYREYTPYEIVDNGKNNVFNIDSRNMSVSIKIDQDGISIINSDLLGNSGLSSMSSNITKVTSEQMLDTEYLLSIGFPTGVDINVV